MVFAYSHYAMIDDLNAYRSSSLIKYEFIFLILTIVSLVVLVITSLILLFKRKWQDLGLCILGIVIGFVCFAIAFSLDEPTLLYMT